MTRLLASLALLFALSLPAAVLAQESGFVPLTDIPAVRAVAETNDLGEFFNYLYVLAVGAAAVIAVLQFVRAGIMYAVMDTGVVEKREAKNLMVMSVLGLLLVLSPAVVFGIINPDILSLRIGVPQQVAPAPAPGPGPSTPAPTSTTPTPLRQTCTIDGAVTTMQSALNAQRQQQATGTISLNIQPYGEAGMGCCRAVRDVDGQACSARESQSFTNTGGAANGGGRLIINYYCTCDGPE